MNLVDWTYIDLQKSIRLGYHIQSLDVASVYKKDTIMHYFQQKQPS